MNNGFIKICCLWLVFLSTTLSAGPLEGSRETDPRKNPFKLSKNFIEEKVSEDSTVQRISPNLKDSSPPGPKVTKVAYEDSEFEKVFFGNLSDDFYDISYIKKNIYADLPVDIKEKLLPKYIEILFLDLIAKGDDYAFASAFDEHHLKVYEILRDNHEQYRIEKDKLSKLTRQLHKAESLSPHQIKDIKNKIEKQESIILVATCHLRKWEDFTKFLVNKTAYRWKGGIKKYGWISGINPASKNYKELGPGITVWSVLNELSNASIYYNDFQFLKADLAAHGAILNFLSLDFSSNSNKDIDLFMKDLAFYALLRYFYEFPADKRLCGLLVNSYLSARDLSQEPINKYIAIPLNFLINSITGQFHKKNNYSPKNLTVEIKNTGVNDEFIDLNKFHILEEIAIFTVRLHLMGKTDEAISYWNANKIKNEGSFFEDVIEGYINGSDTIPSPGSQVMFDRIESDKNLKGSYSYLYSKLFQNLINAIGLRNANQLKKSDYFLRESMIFLEKIANVYIHPPGTTIPSVFLKNSIFLEMWIDFSMNSGLSDEEKSKIILTASTLSLNTDELQYVHGQELVENTKSSYAKDISIKLNNNIIKREMIYEKLLYRALSKDNDKEINLNSILALDKISSILHNSQLYLGKSNKIKRSANSVELTSNKGEIIINLFCLEVNCYAYQKTNSSFGLTSINKDELFSQKDKFFDSIINEKEIPEEGKILGRFLFGKFSKLNEIKDCNIIATSGLANIPFATLSLNGKFLIDHCNIGLYTSVMHLQRKKNNNTAPRKEKWALAIADPIIRTQKELDSIEKTAALIRGVQLSELAELPETEREALAIIGENTETSTLLTRKDAIKENILKQNLSAYEIVSFSTHGLMAGETKNNYHPAILLSDSKNGNLLTTADILDLNGAPTMVLLAICNASNNINNLKTSEINNVANAFLMKGSDAIISTYWSLNSEASVTIIKDALNYYNQGHDINIAFQKSSIDYKNLYPNSPPKDWGAFLVIGNSKKSESLAIKNQEHTGFAYDLAKINERIFLLVGDQINIYDENLTFIKAKRHSMHHLDDEESYDAKFINQQALSLLQVSNKFVSLVNFDESLSKVRRSTIPITSHASKYGPLRITSIAEHQGNIFFALKNYKNSMMLIGKFITQNNRYETYYHDTGISNNLGGLTNGAFHKVNNDIYLLYYFEATTAMGATTYETNSGIPTYCKHTESVGVDLLGIDFVNNNMSNINAQFGQALPTFSRNNLTHIIALDECSDKSKINSVPTNLTKTYEEGLPFEAYNYDRLFLNSGEGPWRVNNFSQFHNVIITNETFFPLVTRNALDDHNGRLTSFGELDYTLSSYGRMFNTVAHRKNGEKQILSNTFDCLSPSALEEDGVLYAVCNEDDGHFNLRRYD